MRFTVSQMDVLRQSADDAWIGELCRHLRTHHGRAVSSFDDEQLCQRVAAGVARARAYGLAARSKVGFFVSLLFEIGPAFDDHPRIRQVLTRGRMSPDERLASLTTELSRQEWEEAARIPPRAVPS